MSTFKVGLTMAGAISAGAYTAGVFDFLVEALDEWEERKQALRAARTPKAKWDVPSHDVVIPVISGASAGGITGALGLLAMAEQPVAGSVPARFQYDQVGTVESRLPRLYNAWVRMPRFIDPAGGSDLLGTEDLADGPVASLLDTTLLGGIVDASVTGFGAIQPPRPYLAEPVHLFLTHSSLGGIPYEVDFLGGQADQPGYPMVCHADRRHFRVVGAGSAEFVSGWAKDDPAVDIDVRKLPEVTAVSGIWEQYADSALATAAFPAGLRARTIAPVTARDYLERQWPIARTIRDESTGAPVFRLRPAKIFGTDAARRCDFVALDGGVINNEPFELARWTLMDEPPERNKREADESDRAVIMVDPFPEPPAYDPAAALDGRLTAAVRGLLPMLKEQARFKPSDLVDALDETVFSRFMVAPRRRKEENAPLEPYAIACGLLGGFGGFLSEEFRAHDYQLGRLNCYLFLRRSFGLPEGNENLMAGYRDLAEAVRQGFEMKDPSDPAGDPPGAERRFYPVIPLLGSAAVMPAPPDWPRVSRAEVDEMVARVEQRAKAVVARLIAAEVGSPVFRTALRVAWPMFGSSRLGSFVRWTVLKDLILRDQIDWLAPDSDHDTRKVLAAFADPAFDFRTAAGIARRTGMTEDAVKEAIRAHKQHLVEGRRTDDGAPTYTLKERAPGWLSQLPGIRHVDTWLWSGEPAVD